MQEDAVRDALRGVLSSGSMLGARLRPLLIEEYRRATTRDIEPVLKSFGKFSAFLAANADLVDVRSDDKSHLQNSWGIRLDGLMAVLPAWSPIALGFIASDLVLQHVWASGEG